MSQINEAYSAIRNCREALEPLHEPARGRSSPQRKPAPERPTYREPDETECSLCGSTPAYEVHAERRVGLILVRRVYSQDVRACRNCGLHIVRHAQDLTLLQGWWGVLSFFLNFVSMGRNAIELRHLGRMEHRRRDPAVRAPLGRPLDPGGSVWARKGVWIGGALFFVAALLGLQDAQQNPQAFVSPSPPAAGTQNPVTRSPQTVTWEDFVGECLAFDSLDRVEDLVDCASFRADSRVVAVVATRDNCPARTDSFLEVETRKVLCLEDT